LLLGRFLRVTKLGGHELEHRVRERDDIRAAVSTIAELSIDRLRKNPNAATISHRNALGLVSRCPHPARE
jgi:hypothetical protein